MPGTEYPSKWDEPYRCTRDCQLGEAGVIGWDRTIRAGRGCTRVNLPPVKWDVDARALLSGPSRRGALYFGRYEDRSLDGAKVLGLPQNWQRPIEPPEDGCPGGWYRTAFLDSVLPYTRRRTEGGGRVPNPFFDRADWQIQEAVLYLEHEEERWHAYREEVNASRWRAGPGKPKPKSRGR